MDNKLKYKIGDKFLSLVKNERTGVDIGDILEIVDIDNSPRREFDYCLCPVDSLDDEDDSRSWWYEESSIDSYAINLNNISDKDFFTVKMTGKLPGVAPMILTRKTDRLLQFYLNAEELIKSGQQVDTWALKYFYGGKE